MWSERPLRLLASSPNVESTTDMDVVVEWSDEPFDVPEGASTVMDSPWFTSHRLPDRYVFDVHLAQLRVDITNEGRHLRVHPLGDDDTDRVVDPADALVTNVLSRIPSLWGDLPLHSACLDTGSGLLLRCAMSGTGKSTLSQLLAARQGWTILDDDTSLLRVRDGDPEVVPMGARSRIRADAAAQLNLVGEILPGYAGAKQALDFVDFDSSRVAGLVINAVVHLLALPADAEGFEALSTTRGTATEGMVSLARSTTPVDPLAPIYRQALMHVGSRLAAYPTWLVTYQRDSAPALDVAIEIESLISLLSSGETEREEPS